MGAIGRFSAFVDLRCPGAGDESVITRSLLEGYRPWLATSTLSAHTRLGYLVPLRTFLDHCRRHGWLGRLAVKATLYSDDFPIQTDSLPDSSRSS